MFKRIMVALDGSPEAGRALLEGIDLAHLFEAKLSVVIVLEPLAGYYSWAEPGTAGPDWLATQKSQSVALQAQARTLISAAGLTGEVEVIDGDEVGGVIASLRKHDCDLLVTGIPSQLRPGGNTNQSLVEGTRCALLGVR